MATFKPNSFSRMPVVMISHGSPNLALMETDEEPVLMDLKKFADSIPKPKGIIIISAHFLSDANEIEVLSNPNPQIIYDFYGFPTELYQVKYDCRGDPKLAHDILNRLVGFFSEEGKTLGRPSEIQLVENDKRGLDHGAWVPLRVMYPNGDVPIVGVSLPFAKDGSSRKNALKLGQALAHFREEGYLIVGSGGIVHNLQKLSWSEMTGAPESWATNFNEWVITQLKEKKVMDLLQFEDHHEAGRMAHSISDHFDPLFVVIGSTLPGDEYHEITNGFHYRSLSMLSFSLS